MAYSIDPIQDHCRQLKRLRLEIPRRARRGLDEKEDRAKRGRISRPAGRWPLETCRL